MISVKNPNMIIDCMIRRYGITAGCVFPVGVGRAACAPPASARQAVNVTAKSLSVDLAIIIYIGPFARQSGTMDIAGDGSNHDMAIPEV